MKVTWTKIEKWLKPNAPGVYKSLNIGASIEDFEELEELINKKLPESFKAFYKVHNGQSPMSEGLIDGEELLCINRIMEEWEVWKELDDKGVFDDSVSDSDKGIREEWWNPLWIPITYDGSGNHFCLDLNPDEGGKKGQIIRIWHDLAERELISNSFEEWMNDYADDLEAGYFVYSEEWGGIIDKEDIEETEEEDE
jgi:cell wall assembly regulator SMI1